MKLSRQTKLMKKEVINKKKQVEKLKFDYKSD